MVNIVQLKLFKNVLIAPENQEQLKVQKMLLKQLQIKQLEIVESTGDVIGNRIVDPVASLFDNNKITRPTS